MDSLAAKEAIRQATRTIEVQENSELHLSPSNDGFADCFVQVQINSYEDLQILGLIPRGLTEEKVRRAVTDDDDEAYRMVSNSLQLSNRNCNCMKRNGQIPKMHRDNFKQAYTSIRRNHQPALAKILSAHYNRSIRWDAPIAIITKRWYDYLNLPISKALLIALAKDIIIHNTAILTVASSIKSLLAHNIIIYKTGKLVQQGKYLKIWASSITYGPPVIEVHVTPPWLR